MERAKVQDASRILTRAERCCEGSNECSYSYLGHGSPIDAASHKTLNETNKRKIIGSRLEPGPVGTSYGCGRVTVHRLLRIQSPRKTSAILFRAFEIMIIQRVIHVAETGIRYRGKVKNKQGVIVHRGKVYRVSVSWTRLTRMRLQQGGRYRRAETKMKPVDTG